MGRKKSLPTFGPHFGYGPLIMPETTSFPDPWSCIRAIVFRPLNSAVYESRVRVSRDTCLKVRVQKDNGLQIKRFGEGTSVNS